MLNFEKQIVVRRDVLMREVEGEGVLVNLQNEHTYHLDQIGAYVWQILTNSDSIQTGYEQILSEFDVAPDQLHNDLTIITENLLQHD